MYGRQCAVTREKAFPALEAAHILRSDVHRLFDAGYVTVTPDYQFEVSDHIHTAFDDGEHYYDLDGTKLWVPRSSEHRPGREHLEWHNENRGRVT